MSRPPQRRRRHPGVTGYSCLYCGGNAFPRYLYCSDACAEASLAATAAKRATVHKRVK